MSHTGENDQAIRQALDFIRKCSIIMLALHCYIFCYGAFKEWGLTYPLVEKTILLFARTPWIGNPYLNRVFILVLVTLSFMGSLGKKDEKVTAGSVTALIISGLVLFFGSALLLYLPLPVVVLANSYMIATSTGFVLYLAGGVRLSRLIKVKLRKDIFNTENESFPQEKQLRSTPDSINLKAKFRFQNKTYDSYVNFANLFRALLVLGSPGSR